MPETVDFKGGTVPKLIPYEPTNMTLQEVLQESFGMPKISRRLLKLKLMQEKHNRGLNDGKWCLYKWPDVFLRCFMMVLRSPLNLKISLIAFPSGINFRTVWGLHYKIYQTQHLPVNMCYTAYKHLTSCLHVGPLSLTRVQGSREIWSTTLSE